MKVGILTLPLETNYGGNLQAFALQKTIRDMGHEAITIDRHNRKEYRSFKHHLAGYVKRIFLHYVRGQKVSTKWNPFISVEDYRASSVETQKFIDRNIKLTRRVFSDQLAEVDKEYMFDAYVVGSDQVWLDKYCPMSFLSFVNRDGVRKVTYAASCGKESFFNNSNKVKACKLLAKEFNGISVREETLVNKCKDLLDIDAKWVIDPTMLLKPKDYLNATENHVGEEPILFSYVLDATPDKNKIISAIAKDLNLPVVNGNRLHNPEDASKAFPSVDDWIHNINRSQFVITDSFHGTVFAILFNKPFITIGNTKRGIDRFTSILDLFSLNSRLVLDGELLKAIDIYKLPIDFDKVNNVLETERCISVQFLEKSLNHNV